MLQVYKEEQQGGKEALNYVITAEGEIIQGNMLAPHIAFLPRAL